MREDETTELRRIVDNCSRMRQALLRLAGRTSRSRRRLSLASGVLALVSASVPSLGLGPTGTVVAALLAVAAGTISLLLSVTLKDTEVGRLHEGAARYLSLRDRTYRVLMSKAMPADQAGAAVADAQQAYADLDKEYRKVVVEYLGDEGIVSRPPGHPGPPGPG